MIHHVRGTVAEKPVGRVVVDVGGVGLEILVTDGTWNEVGTAGDPVRLLTHLKVAEDAWTLYGFAHADERAVFRLLIGVQGVSPRVAIAILSVLAPGALRRAVQEGDLDALTAVTGVGKKIAQRILVDLRDKVGAMPGGAARVLSGDAAAGGPDAAVDALVALGYSRGQAREAVHAARDAAPDAGIPVETIVRDALRRI
jgi:Holliday junction DNA helicase RuvA